MASNIVSRLRGVKSSQAIKVPCLVATTANITLSGEQTIDGVLTIEGDRVLVKNQNTASENGIYEVSTGAWRRAPDWDGIGDVVTGTRVYVTAGTLNRGEWLVTTTGTITIGTTSVVIAGGSFFTDVNTSDDITEGSTNLLLTVAERAKLATLAPGGAGVFIVREDYASWAAAIAAAVLVGEKFIYVKSSSTTISGSTDFQGIGIIGNGTAIGNTSDALNLGPLTNCTVRGYATDVDFISQGPTGGGVHKKLVYRDSASGSAERLYVIMKRRGTGYVSAEHWYGSFTSGLADTGTACENWRACVTRWLSEVYIYKQTADDETAAAWGSLTSATVSQVFPGAGSAQALQYRATSTLNAEIAWDVTATHIGQVGYVGIYSTSGSSGTVELYVNAVLQRTFSATLVGTQYVLRVPYELDLIGTNEVRLKKTGANSLNVLGAEFWPLSEYPGARTVTHASWGIMARSYVAGNGASDYALFSSAEQKWFGSVHGGETDRSAAQLIVDGAQTTIPASAGDFVVGDQIQLQQATTIATGSDTLDVDSAYTYYEDGRQQFDCQMDGSATVETAYTCMTATNEEFDFVRFPKYVQVAEGLNLLGRHNMVTQINRAAPTQNMGLTTIMTLFPMGGANGANMQANGPYISGQSGSYNKLYYGPVVDSEATLTDLAFQTVRIFE